MKEDYREPLINKDVYILGNYDCPFRNKCPSYDFDCKDSFLFCKYLDMYLCMGGIEEHDE